MRHKVKVAQVLRVEKPTVIAVEADLPSASDDTGKVWLVERNSLENEEYLRTLCR